MFNRFLTFAVWSRCLLLVLTFIGGPIVVFPQDQACRQEFPDYMVRSVKIHARWLPEAGSSAFVDQDLKNASALIGKLKQPTTLARYLLAKLSAPTVTLINGYSSGPPQSALVHAIVEDFNKLLNGPLLFQKEAFAQVSISVDTQILFDQKPTGGEGLFRLNRMLLEDAFPTELAKDPKLFLALHRNGPFTPANLSATRFSVIRAINRQRERFNSEFVKLGKFPLVDVNLITACGRAVPATECEQARLGDKCVDVEVHPYAVSSDPAFMGSVLLPLPRANTFSFVEHAPRALRLLNPKFSVVQDKELGTMPGFEVSTDLLSANKVLESEDTESRRAELIFKAKASKSINKRYYSAHAALLFTFLRPARHVESVGVTAGFDADSEPQLNGVHLNNGLQLGANITVDPEWGIVNRALFEVAYKRSAQRLSGNTTAGTFGDEDSLHGRAILEGRIFNGFARAGLWFEHAKPDFNRRSYQRWAGLIGYEKELPLGEQTVGIEALFGIGHASANTPKYSLFYGGNTLQTFLYDNADDPTLTNMPSGPVLRSFGANQAGFALSTGRTGASGYQHFNLNLTIPIPKLSKPLIHDEVVIEQPRKTLRNLIAFAVNSGQEALSSYLEDEGLSSDEADKQAARTFAQIRPGVMFLANHGKIYSLKPMIMFDHSRLSLTGVQDGQVRNAIGGGLQLTIVVAKFEAGYMRTMHPLPGDSRGNFVMRLVFQNLF